MKKLALLFALSLGFLSCSDSSEPVTPKNKMFGTKWERFALKSPIDNREIWVYLEFPDNTTVKEYKLFDKTENANADKSGTYTVDGENVMLIIDGNASLVKVSGDELVLKNNYGVFLVYKKVY